MNSLADASSSEISFVSSEAHANAYKATRAGAVIVQKKLKLPENPNTTALLVDDAELSVAKSARALRPPISRPPSHASHRLCRAQRLCRRRRTHRPRRFHRRQLSHRTQRDPSPQCLPRRRRHPRRRLRVLPQRRRPRANRYRPSRRHSRRQRARHRWLRLSLDGTKHSKVPQIGTVIIEDDVEIGSCVCIDRAKFAATRIGRGTKIDNLVQIGHNVQVGPHCIIVGQAGLAGSATLGTGVVLGGQSAVRDHITMGDGSMLAACSGVMENVDPKAIFSGLPALPHRQSLREQAALRRLPDLVVQVRKLKEELEELKKQK